MLTPFERALVANLIADWILQNDWMAKNKASLVHPAAWTHAAIHAVTLGLALNDWRAGLVLGTTHMLIDTRVPANWWRTFFRQTSEGPIVLLLKVALDQVLHITAIAAWIEIAGRLGT
jgi:hypothetical protein